MVSTKRKNYGRLEGRVVLVTGASRGIGREIATGYAREGAHVIAVGRTKGALEEIDDTLRCHGCALTLVPADLEKPQTANAIAAAVSDRFGRLDVLVANAAILGGLRPLHDYDDKIWKKVMDINLDANWRLVRAFNPLLRVSSAGRVIFLTSSVGHIPRAYWGAYAVSKAGLEMLAKIYQLELKNTNVRVMIVDPGKTRTGMRAEAYPGESPETLKHPEQLIPAFVNLADSSYVPPSEIIDLSD